MPKQYYTDFPRRLADLQELLKELTMDLKNDSQSYGKVTKNQVDTLKRIQTIATAALAFIDEKGGGDA